MITIHSISMYPQMLVSNLSGISDRTAFTENTSLGNDEDKKTALNELEQLVFNNTHNVIRAILNVAPLAGRTALLQVI